MRFPVRAVVFVGVLLAGLGRGTDWVSAQSPGYPQAGPQNRGANQSSRYATTGSRTTPASPRQGVPQTQGRSNYPQATGRSGTSTDRTSGTMSGGNASPSVGSQRPNADAAKRSDPRTESTSARSERSNAPPVADALKLV